MYIFCYFKILKHVYLNLWHVVFFQYKNLWLQPMLFPNKSLHGLPFCWLKKVAEGLYFTGLIDREGLNTCVASHTRLDLSCFLSIYLPLPQSPTNETMSTEN